MASRKSWSMSGGAWGLLVAVLLMGFVMVMVDAAQAQQGLGKATGDGAKAGTTSGAAPGSAAKAAKAAAAAAPVENVKVNVGAEKEKIVEVHAGGSCDEDLCTAPPAEAVVDKVGVAVDSAKDEKIKALEIQLAQKTKELEAATKQLQEANKQLDDKNKQLQLAQDESSKLKSENAAAIETSNSRKEAIAKLEADLKKSSEDVGKLQQTLALSKRQQETEKIAADQVIATLNEKVKNLEAASAASSSQAAGESNAELSKCQADLAKLRKDFDENQLIILSKRAAVLQSNAKVYAIELSNRLSNLTQVYAEKARALAKEGSQKVTQEYWPVVKEEINKLYLEGKPRLMQLKEEFITSLHNAKPKLIQLKEVGIKKAQEKLIQLENYFESQNAFLPAGVSKPPQTSRYMAYAVAGIVALIAFIIVFKIIKLIFWILLAPIRFLRGNPKQQPKQQPKQPKPKNKN